MRSFNVRKNFNLRKKERKKDGRERKRSENVTKFTAKRTVSQVTEVC